MEETESLKDILSKLDPATIGIAILFTIFLIVTYRKEIKAFFETFVVGYLMKKKHKDPIDELVEPENTSNTDEQMIKLLSEIRDNLKTMNQSQEVILSKQNELFDEIQDMKQTNAADIANLNSKLEVVSNQCDFLMDSDKEDKKAYIIRAYNYFYVALGKIDIYNKESLEKIYDLYLIENGDTFVAGLMSALRTIQVVPHLTESEIRSSNMGSFDIVN